MHQLKSIAVYCGSNLGENRRYHEDAQELGRHIANRGSRLIYGGGRIGLMGTVADAVLASGGEVVGVIPKFLRQKEVAHTGLNRLIETADMAERRLKMIELADAFIALPGGLGTYEELFEVLSSAQLRLHEKPIGLLDSGGFFAPLLALLRQTVTQGFMPEANLSLLCIADNPAELFRQMAAYRYRDAQKWHEPAWKRHES